MKINSKIRGELVKHFTGRNISLRYIEVNYPKIHKFVISKENPVREFYNLLYSEGRCLNCSQPARFINFKKGYAKYCGVRCSNSHADKIQTTKRNYKEKYGVDSPAKNPEVFKKMVATMNERYGVSYTGQSKKLRKKMEKTNLKRYGCKNPLNNKKIKRKIAKTNLTKYGCENPLGNKKVRAKVKSTMIERYGVVHNMQNRRIFEKQNKSGYNIKTLKLDGKTFRVRGYEDEAIKYLRDRHNVKVKNIKTTASEGVPSFNWVDSKGNPHVYHPDLYVKIGSDYYVVEVKSTYTVGAKHKSMWNIVKKKSKSVDDANFNFILLIITTKKKVIPVSEPWKLTRKQVLRLINGER